MTSNKQQLDNEVSARALEASVDYRVLRRFVPLAAYAPGHPAAPRRAVVVDVETTGTDTTNDRIIEFAAVALTYDSTSGEIFGVDAPVSFLEDPERPIPPEIVRLTGITDAMVAGTRLDEAAIGALVADANVVIAHNAAFDRKFVERRLPAFADKPWACSQREIPWRENGIGSAALEFLLFRHAGAFFVGHRAGVDCQAVVHLLATPLASGQLPMRLLLDSARRRTARVWAVDSHFDFKDALKRRGYRWFAGDDGRAKCWYRDMPEEERDAELAWLGETVYAGRRAAARVDILDARQRFRD